MKKVFRLLIAATIAALLILPVCASAAAPTPWSDKSMNIFVLEDFEELSGNAASTYCNTILESEYKNGGLLITSNSDWTGNVQYKTQKRHQMTSLKGIIGFGMYVKNTLSQPVGFVGHWYGCPAEGMDSEYADVSENKPFYAVSKDGAVTSCTTGANGMTIISNDENGDPIDGIPAGFEGYLLFTFDSLKGAWHNTDFSKIAVNPNATDLIGLRLGQIIPEDGKGLLIDNLFVYGTSEMEKNDIIKVNDPGSQTADVSVLCYAAAAVAGLGSLVIAKKK